MQFETLPQADHELVALRPIVAADIPLWFEYLALPVVYKGVVARWTLRDWNEVLAP